MIEVKFIDIDRELVLLIHRRYISGSHYTVSVLCFCVALPYCTYIMFILTIPLLHCTLFAVFFFLRRLAISLHAILCSAIDRVVENLITSWNSTILRIDIQRLIIARKKWTWFYNAAIHWSSVPARSTVMQDHLRSLLLLLVFSLTVVMEFDFYSVTHTRAQFSFLSIKLHWRRAVSSSRCNSGNGHDSPAAFESYEQQNLQLL